MKFVKMGDPPYATCIKYNKLAIPFNELAIYKSLGQYMSVDGVDVLYTYSV